MFWSATSNSDGWMLTSSINRTLLFHLYNRGLTLVSLCLIHSKESKSAGSQPVCHQLSGSLWPPPFTSPLAAAADAGEGQQPRGGRGAGWSRRQPHCCPVAARHCRRCPSIRRSSRRSALRRSSRRRRDADVALVTGSCTHTHARTLTHAHAHSTKRIHPSDTGHRRAHWPARPPPSPPPTRLGHGVDAQAAGRD